MPELTATQPQQPAGQQPANLAASAIPANYDEWFANVDEPTKAIISTRFTALENTVKSTRDERDALRSQIRELMPRAEKGSELEKTLTEFTSKLDAAEKRAVFAEEAGRQDIACTNPKAAYLVAAAENLFDRKGNPDWTAIKGSAPELFRTPTANANAGAGTQKPPAHASMNEFIRSKGRST